MAGGLWLVVACSVTAARAQGSATSPMPRFEASGGVATTGGTDFGAKTGSLTANDPGDPDFALFKTSTSLGHGAGAEGHLGVNFTRVVAIEGAFSWMRQTAATRVTGDAEGIPDVTVTQTVSAYTVEGAVVVHLPQLAFNQGRGLPFVFAGGGYLRQLDDKQVLTGTGGVFDTGAGLKYFFVQRPSGFVRAFGLSADGRIVVRSGGFDPTGAGGSHTTWGAFGGLVARF